jgi:hypothetical protein
MEPDPVHATEEIDQKQKGREDDGLLDRRGRPASRLETAEIQVVDPALSRDDGAATALVILAVDSALPSKPGSPEGARSTITR